MTNIYFICWTNDENPADNIKQPVRRKQLHAVKTKKIFRLKKSFVVVSRIFYYFQPGLFPIYACCVKRGHAKLLYPDPEIQRSTESREVIITL